MASNKRILIMISLFFMLFCGCITNNYKHPNQILEEVKPTFGIETNKSNLLDHFPKKIKNNNSFFEVNPPSCPPTYQCSAQFGDVFLNVDKHDYQEELSELFKGQIMYKAAYSDSNIIINLSELRKTTFPKEKCNQWYPDKLPIPYFESYDFGLGQKETKKEVEGETFFDYIHTIPSDLQVYVVQAEVGDFWKESCNEKRPISLKEWQHGYSRGFAVSEKENKLIYWTLIW